LVADKYIAASCVISINGVFKNGTDVFENKQADMPAYFLSIYKHFKIAYPKFYKMDNLSKLGWLAAEILLQEFAKDDYLSEETGIILSNSNSSLDTDLRYFETIKDMASPSLFVYTLPNIMTGEICIRHNFKGENAFFISDGFDAALMEQYVGNLLDCNILSVCICGWVDVYEDAYEAALFLVKKGNGDILFTKENMDRIFKTAVAYANV
jgi:hypothetical protein